MLQDTEAEGEEDAELAWVKAALVTSGTAFASAELFAHVLDDAVSLVITCTPLFIHMERKICQPAPKAVVLYVTTRLCSRMWLILESYGWQCLIFSVSVRSPRVLPSKQIGDDVYVDEEEEEDEADDPLNEVSGKPGSVKAVEECKI